MTVIAACQLALAIGDPEANRAAAAAAVEQAADSSAEIVLTPGDAPPPVVSLPAGRVALMICYDLEFPEWVRLAALRGADLITAPVNWPAMPVPAGERPADVVRVQAGAAVNGLFIAVADRCRAERGVSWVGGTVIVGPDGYPLAGPVTADRPSVLAVECSLARARNKQISTHNDVISDRRPALYGPSGPCHRCARPGHQRCAVAAGRKCDERPMVNAQVLTAS